MLRELSCGEARSVLKLSAVAGCSYQSAVKHLAVPHVTGLALRGRGKPVVDFGHCQLRLNAAG